MSHHSTTIPLSVFDPNDETGDEIEVSFDWTPGTPESGLTGPPENYDPGSGEEFYIVDCDAAREHHDRIAEYLEENWERPDYAAEAADHRYEDYRERMREAQDD